MIRVPVRFYFFSNDKDDIIIWWKGDVSQNNLWAIKYSCTLTQRVPFSILNYFEIRQCSINKKRYNSLTWYNNDVNQNLWIEKYAYCNLDIRCHFQYLIILKCVNVAPNISFTIFYISAGLRISIKWIVHY
jgi:hypothetical protein